MTEEQINKYNSHVLFLLDIAEAILNNNKSAIDINGVKEIIALYLMIPYMTPKTLITPNENCVIPRIDGMFYGHITYEDLRNTISHSFVTTEEYRNDGSNHGKFLIFDDRICTSKKEHSKKGFHGNCYKIQTEYVRNELLKQIQNIRKNSML